MADVKCVLFFMRHLSHCIGNTAEQIVKGEALNSFSYPSWRERSLESCSDDELLHHTPVHFIRLKSSNVRIFSQLYTEVIIDSLVFIIHQH